MATTKSEKKENTIRSEAVADLREIKKLIKAAVDNGAKNVEEVHQAIAGMPYKYIEKIQMLENSARNVKEAQEKTIGQVYKLLRNINDKVDELAEDILDKVEGKAA